MRQYPEPVVGVYIRNQQGQVLLFKSKKWENGKMWAVCGGHIEYGESMVDTVKREVMEEAGVEVEKIRHIATFEGIFPPYFHEKKHFIYIQYEAYIKLNQIIKLDNDELQEYRWFDLKDVFKEHHHPVTRQTLELLANKSQP